ncbi:MAG TPA: rhodanese-like domain-containing protein [Thermoanaerobaculia bacterium]|nr:rhodanese-like domain-containing protein [Thermoanaerobaculia bacterium]
MRKLSVVAAATLFAVSLHAQYKDKPPAVQPQPALPPLMTTSPAMAAPQPPTDGARRIARPDAIKMVKAGKAIFIDVRSRDQYDLEHIKGAINIPLDEITKRPLPKNKFLITYCA